MPRLQHKMMLTGHASKHDTLQVRSKGDMGQHVVQACKRAAVLRLTEHSFPTGAASVGEEPRAAVTDVQCMISAKTLRLNN